MSPPQRELFHKMQGVMALLEGHASFVMNQVAEGRVEDLPRMKRALSSRRRVGGLERGFQRAIGFESKVEQYTTGERFVARVVDRSGMSAFNLVWAGPENLPSVEEIAEPERWISRVTEA
jgi:putative hydrolase